MTDSIDDQIINHNFGKTAISVYMNAGNDVFPDGNIFLFKMFLKNINTLTKQSMERNIFGIIKLIIIYFSQQQQVFIDTGTAGERSVHFLHNPVLFFCEIAILKQ